MPPDVPKIVIPAARHNLKMLTGKHNDEKLAITFLILGAGLIAYHFYVLALGLMQQRLAAPALDWI